MMNRTEGRAAPLLWLRMLALLSSIMACAQLHAEAASSPDPLFDQPYVDIDEWRDTPVRHRYVHGGFKGTETRFSFYLPPSEQYEGRFFQYITPVPDSENVSQGAQGEEDKIGFAIASGAYFVETNGGGPAGASLPGGSGVDPTIAAYRANAASARYSRVIAQQFYGGKRPWGYAFGGSGGGFRTIGGAENTVGVWDGFVPFVIGSPMAIPNVFSVRMHAMRVLRDKFPQIVDAVEPGGSGDMYAGLNEEEREALAEVTRMGFPPESWFGYETMGVHAFAVLYPGVVMADPGYFTDFWTVPGYLGANPPESLLKARVQHRSTIAQVITAADAGRMKLDVGRMAGQGRGTADKAWQSLQEETAKIPVAFRLASAAPDVDFMGGDLVMLTGAAAGKAVALRQLAGNVVVPGAADPAVLDGIEPGDEVRVDNSNFLAAQTYHRHQVAGRDFPVWDQFRGADGQPIYPQRPMLLGPLFAAHASGTVQTGKFEGKMIVVASLWDREAFPWQADWYRSRVEEHLGERTDDNFRLWYVDHALHHDGANQEDPTRTISYLGVLQQALRDVAAWVENGVAPPASTDYVVVDGQVQVPPTAAERKGIQPVVTLTANGGERADVRVGEPVTFSAGIEVPPGTGVVVGAEWDFEGLGDYPIKEQFDPGRRADRLTLQRTHTFTRPGTYFPALRASSQHPGDAGTIFARPQNLGRVRVVVQ